MVSLNPYNILQEEDDDNQSTSNENIVNKRVVKKKKIIDKNLEEPKRNDNNARRHRVFEDNEIDYTNRKRILCYNVLNIGKCNYGDKCMYAHKLEEQKVDYNRERMYECIRNKSDMSDIDLQSDKDLYKLLLQMTKTCNVCMRNLCPGGYNCKYGVVDSKYQICYDDMMSGDCDRSMCKYVHLTNQGLSPYIPTRKQYITDYGRTKYSDIVKQGITNVPVRSSVEIIKNNIKKKSHNSFKLIGTLLTDDYFKDNKTDIEENIEEDVNEEKNKKKKTDEYDSDTEQSEESIEKMIEYLNKRIR